MIPYANRALNQIAVEDSPNIKDNRITLKIKSYTTQ